MAVPQGGVFNIVIYQGAPFVQTFALREDDEETVIPLTDFTAEAQLRPRVGSETLLATFACSVNEDDGEVTISLTEETTSGLSQSGYYDIFLDNGIPDDRVMFMEGLAELNQRVTT